MQESDRFVRDLLWAVNSPNLMMLTSQTSVPTRLLSSDDIDAVHLNNYFESHSNQTVGRYFERLIAYWVSYVRGCEIVAQSLQLQDHNRTIGEVDLLFRDEQNRLNHWEIACKFYLQGDVDDSRITDYIGPNSNDTLQKKATRLQEHQLPLGRSRFPEIELQEAFVKGRIFYHWRTQESNQPIPIELSQGHLQGKWLRGQELPELLARNQQQLFRILQKPFWLAKEIADLSDGDILSAAKLRQVVQDHFIARNTPLLVSGFHQGTLPAIESERWFVVPNDWPQQRV